MAQQTITTPPPYHPASLPSLSQRDLETASIRSAAPSYTSAAPSYHSTSPFSDSSSALPRRTSAPEPSLAHFTPHSGWSTVRANPTARHYHSVAHRRASASHARISAAAVSPNPMRSVLSTLEEEERRRYATAHTVTEGEGEGGLGSWERLRPLEDPELVGVEAAEQARRERLGWGKGVLEREDRRWDWLLGQMKDWEEREKSWGKFRNEVEGGKRKKLARRLGL